MDTSDSSPRLDPLTAFYADALELLVASRLPFLVGGTFAYARYTGIDRETKDMDVFVRPSDLARTLATFEDAGYVSEVPCPHWLAKVSHAEHVMDIVFGSGNGIALVDDEWFLHAVEAEVLGVQVRLCPPEEMIPELTRRMVDQKAEPDHHVCYGTLLSREQYLHDTGGLTRTEATIWTDAIKKDE